jgi:hypothetical protein
MWRMMTSCKSIAENNDLDYLSSGSGAVFSPDIYPAAGCG